MKNIKILLLGAALLVPRVLLGQATAPITCGNDDERHLAARVTQIPDQVTEIEERNLERAKALDRTEEAVARIEKQLQDTPVINSEVADDGDVTGSLEGWIAPSTGIFQQARALARNLERGFQKLSKRWAVESKSVSRLAKRQSRKFQDSFGDFRQQMTVRLENLRQAMDGQSVREKAINARYERLFKAFVKKGAKVKEVAPLRRLLEPPRVPRHH